MTTNTTSPLTRQPIIGRFNVTSISSAHVYRRDPVYAVDRDELGAVTSVTVYLGTEAGVGTIAPDGHDGSGRYWTVTGAERNPQRLIGARHVGTLSEPDEPKYEVGARVITASGPGKIVGHYRRDGEWHYQVASEGRYHYADKVESQLHGPRS